jgi:RimJ/RimL family protein N-acetyltransferase
MEDFSFEKTSRKHHNLILDWLDKEHVRKFWYGDGLLVTISDLEKHMSKKQSRFNHWIAYINNVPFAYLLTSEVEEDSKKPDDLLLKYKIPGSKAITLDLLIGAEEYLGKGLSKSLILFFLEKKFPLINEVFIDPELNNSRAIHVYEKTGFKKLEKFTPVWNPVPHLLMKLNLN